ncbi:MAG: hypothetical protein ACK4NR_10990 [Micavibrio sp.]
MTIKRPLLFCFTLTSLLTPLVTAGGTDAHAQMCDTLREVITVIRAPTYGFPTVWDADYGMKGQAVQFGGSVLLAEGTIMSQALRMDDRKPEEKKVETDAPKGQAKEKVKPAEEMGLVELNRRGRVFTEAFYPVKNNEYPAGLIKLGERFIGISNMKVGKKADRHVRVAWYDRKGVYKRDLTIQDASYDYEAEMIVPAVDGNGFVVVIHAVNRSDRKDQFGVLARYTADGAQIWKRAYRPGVNNMLAGLSATEDKGYLASGKIIMDDGRMAGWVLKLAADGTILWQRTYPRGKYSVLNAGAPSSHKNPDGSSYYAVAGAAEPIDGHPYAAWIMEIDHFGEPVWQRYYRRTDYSFDGQAVNTLPDGRIQVVVNAKAEGSVDPLKQDHVRIFSLSPRGVMLDDQSYVNGLRAQAVDSEMSSRYEMVVTSNILMQPKITEEMFGPEKPLPEGTVPEIEMPFPEGWVMITPSPDSYDDPCIRKPRR